MSDPFVISIVNSKGGVAKTCTSVNLAASVAGRVGKNLKVLIIDQDPQMNTTTLLLDPDKLPSRDKTLWTIYGDDPYDGDGLDLFHRTRIEGLYILPSSLMLEGVELRSAKLDKVQLRLKLFVERCCRSFDLIVIDNGPSVNVFSINSLLASTHYLLTSTREKMSLDGLDRLESTAVEFAKRINPGLKRLGLVLTIDRGGSGPLPYEPIAVIHDSDTMRSACSRGRTVMEIDPSGNLQREIDGLSLNVLSQLSLPSRSVERTEDTAKVEGKRFKWSLSGFLNFWRRR